MCIHIQSKTIGNVDEQHCSLFHAVERIVEAAQKLPSLWDVRFTQHTDEEIFSWLDALLYSGEITCENGNDPHRFDFLTNTGEQFDDSKTYIVSLPEGFVRILFFKDKRFGSASCQSATFLLVATSLGHWFKEQTGGRSYA